MPRLNFFKKKYDESTVLERARKQATEDWLVQAVEMLYFNEQIPDEELAKALKMDVDQVKLRVRPRALHLIQQERAKNASTAVTTSTNSTVAPPTPGENEAPIDATQVTELPPSSIDDLEAEAIHIVMNSHSGVTLNAQIKKRIIFVFKTFAPLAVLCLTIPESLWVFTNIYSRPDTMLLVLTGIFAVLVDLGYLSLTVLLELNKEAMFYRRRAGLEVEQHEVAATRLQSVLWWIVAGMDTVAQVVFLYGATKDSTFFDQRVVLLLVGIRIASLFITMFVVSFAGTELMTDVDVAANAQVERAGKVKRVLTALAEAREEQQEARHKIEQMEADRRLRREGEQFLTDLYADAREEAKRLRERVREERKHDSDNDESGKLR